MCHNPPRSSRDRSLLKACIKRYDSSTIFSSSWTYHSEYLFICCCLQVISALLRPRNWKPPGNRKFFLDSYEVGELCYAAEQIFMHEQTVLQLKAPIKVFGDLHGQFGDLMRLFDEYGFPSTAGDIT